MKPRNQIGLFLAMALASSASMAIEDHQAAPMLAPASDVLSDWNELEEEKKDAQDKDAKSMDRDAVLGEFRLMYKQVGEPKIAIFWNRKFTDRLSQWEAVARSSFTAEGSGNVSDVFNKQGDINESNVSISNEDAANQPVDSYERNINAKGQTLVSGYSEVKVHQSNRTGMGEVNDFEFGAGYVQPLLAGSAQIVDRNTIMRLVERDGSRANGSEQIADYQKVETDALVGYADYFAEIVFAEDFSAELGMTFMVTVKEVSSGRIVVMFKSDGQVIDNSDPETRWIATSSGYEKVEIGKEPATPESVGEQLAYETMQSLTRVWSN